MKKLLLMIMLFVAQLAYSQAAIQFKVNTTTIIENENYAYYQNTIIPKIINEDVENILIIGAASPEGNYEKNLKLAKDRAEKIYSQISSLVPREKITISTNYDLFLLKTELDERDYKKLRATYIEVSTKPKEIQKDTVYIRDTVYKNNTYNYYINNTIDKHSTPVFAVYNDLAVDLTFRLNLGIELYFKKMSFFIEGAFSDWSLFGKTYNIDTWHTGFRKYFNYEYSKIFIEIYANAGYFDTDLFSDMGKIGVLYGGGIGLGWTFDLCDHWKLSPIVRIGLFERIYYADYYYIDNGNINISFNNYTNGSINGNTGETSQNKKNIITTNKTLTREFFENCNKAYYIGPTYIGLVIKRDFCIKHKK